MAIQEKTDRQKLEERTGIHQFTAGVAERFSTAVHEMVQRMPVAERKVLVGKRQPDEGRHYNVIGTVFGGVDRRVIVFNYLLSPNRKDMIGLNDPRYEIIVVDEGDVTSHDYHTRSIGLRTMGNGEIELDVRANDSLQLQIKSSQAETPESLRTSLDDQLIKEVMAAVGLNPTEIFNSQEHNLTQDQLDKTPLSD